MRDLIPWVAGILEGEGCIHIGKPRRGESYVPVTIRVAMTDHDVVDRLQAVTGCGTLRYINLRGENCKPVKEWCVCNKPDIYKLLLQLRPYFLSRRLQKCDEALGILMKDKRVQKMLV